MDFFLKIVKNPAAECLVVINARIQSYCQVITNKKHIEIIISTM